MRAPPPSRDNPLTRSVAGMIGMGVLAAMVLACVLSLPYTVGTPSGESTPRFNQQHKVAVRLPPSWTGPELAPDDAPGADTVERRMRAAAVANYVQAHSEGGAPPEAIPPPTEEQLAAHAPSYFLGSDTLGRSLLIRCLAGGGISLGIGIAAAMLSVLLGTLYGSIAGYIGGRTDAVMMRIVDILYGLPYILLVVLLAVASDAVIDEYVSRSRARAAWVQGQVGAMAIDREAKPAAESAPSGLRDLIAEYLRTPPDEVLSGADSYGGLMDRLGRAAVPPRELSGPVRMTLDLVVLFVAIGGVSWLTMARVVRGQVLSLKAQPFMEAARAMGVGVPRQFTRHLLPNLMGPIIVYATLTVPQAILQESFLSFLGIGVRPPLPSWGNLAAEGLSELNPYRSHWWLLVFPCVLLGVTLLALNFVGEGLREALDPKRRAR